MKEYNNSGKKRFRFLFRRDRSKDMYAFPAVDTLSEEEKEAEIKLRFKSMQRQGLVPCDDPAWLDQAVPMSKNTHEVHLEKPHIPKIEEIIRHRDALPSDVSKTLHPHLKPFVPKHKMKRK